MASSVFYNTCMNKGVLLRGFPVRSAPFLNKRNFIR